jgi:hypothetical protein
MAHGSRAHHDRTCTESRVITDFGIYHSSIVDAYVFLIAKAHCRN